MDDSASKLPLPTCVACGAPVEATHRYCATCGEQLRRPPLTLRGVFTQAFHTFSKLDHGFLYNLKVLTVAPKRLVAEYLSGQRRRIYNPLAYALVMTTLYLFADSVFYDPGPRNSDGPPPVPVFELAYETGRFLRIYFKYVWLSGVVWLGLAARLMFGQYRLAEHLAISGFLIGHATLVAVLTLIPFGYAIIFNPFLYAAIMVMLFATYGTKAHLFQTVVQVLSVMLLFLGQLVVVAFAGALALMLIRNFF